MNIEHFKKRLIHQHQKPVLETATKSAKDDPDDDASSNSSGSSGSNGQKQGKKKEGAVQSKVARKRAVCRSKFRHNSLKIFKLGSSIPTSLCKSKEPYNVSTEKNLELCCENKKKSQNNNKKEEHTSKESITEQIIHSIEGNSKKELQRNNSKTEYCSINSSSKLSGKHILPAIVPEIPVKKQRNSISRSSEDEQKSNGSSETSSNKNDQAKQDPLPSLISYRRKTAGGEISTENNENIQNTSPKPSNCMIKENREIPTKPVLVDQKILDKKERISPDSTSTLEISKVSTLKNTNYNSPTFQSDKVNLTQTIPTIMPFNISLPRNTSITPIVHTQKQVPDYLAQNIPANRESQHAIRESSQPNKQPPYENTQPYPRNTEAPVTNVEARCEYKQSQYANREIPYASIETPYANRQPICASRETSYANTNHPFSQYVNRDVPYAHRDSAYENRHLPYSNIPQTYPTQQYAVQSNLFSSVDFSKSNDPQRYMPVSQIGTVNNPQLFPNKSNLPVAATENPINLSVKERNELQQLNYQHPHHYEQYKGVVKPTATRVNDISNIPVSLVPRTPGLQSKSVLGVNGIHKINGLVNTNFPEIQQQLSRCSNQNTYLPTGQVPPLTAQNPQAAEIINSMMHMTYTIMHTSSFTVDNLITLSHFYKNFLFVLNTPNTPHTIKYHLEDIVNEVLSFVTLRLFKKSGINPILRQYTKQVLELDLQHHSDLLRDVFHLMADKCYDPDWMRSFFMLMSRSGPKYPVFSKASDNGSTRKPKTSSNLNSATTAPYQLPVPNYTQGKKARSNAQIKKTYKPRGPQVKKRNIEQVIPNYLTEPHKDTPGSSASCSYPTDSRYIPPKIGLTVSPNEPIPIPVEKLTTVPPEKACNMYATDNTPKNSVQNSSKEEHSLLKKIIDKEDYSLRNNVDNETVIIQDKSMEVTKGDKATTLMEENAQLTTPNSNKNDITVEKISVDTLDVAIKQEQSNDVITKTTEDLKLFKELLREEDKDVYNKVLKKLIGVKETRTASEVITIEDEEDSSATRDISSKDSISTKNSSISNHPDVVVIEDEVSTQEKAKDNSDYNQNNTSVEEINKPKIFKVQTPSKVLSSSKELDTVNSNIQLSTSGASLAVQNLETSTPKRPRPAASKTAVTEKIELLTPKINRQVESSAVQMQIAEKNVEAATPKTSATEKTEPLVSKMNRKAESPAVQMQIDGDNVEAITSKSPIKNSDVDTARIPYIRKSAPSSGLTMGNTVVKVLKSKQPITEKDVEMSISKTPPAGRSVEPSKWNSPIAERGVEILIRQTSTNAITVESLKVKIPITDQNLEVSRLQSPVTKNNVNTVNNPIPLAVEDISSDEDDMKPYSQTVGYGRRINSPKRLVNATNFNICKFVGNNEILPSLNRTQNAMYTMPPVPAGVPRSESNSLLHMARVCENRESVSCNIKVNIEPPFVYSNPHFLVDESVSQPPSCNTPERISPRYAQSPGGLISPLPTASDLDLLAKSGATWNNWEESKKEFLDSTLSCRRQSVETISSIGSDYSPSTDHDDNHVKIRIDTKWYRVKKTVLDCIPKGKLLYDREKNYLIRYFDDNQLEQFIKNVNINVMVTSSYLQHMKDSRGGYLSDNIFLTPFEVTEKNEVIQLSSDISFTKDDNISDAQLYVQEFQKVEQYVPKDFFGFYRFVTGYQIINNHHPISFQTFLTMHNTNRIKSFLTQYLLSVLENR